MGAAQEVKEGARAVAPPPNGATDSAADPFKAEIERALADVRATLGATAISERAPLFSVDAATLLTKEFTAPQWLVTGLVTRGGQAMIGGLPKAAKKTWLATEIAVAIATGSRACGEFYAAAGSVAYFFAEDMEQQIRNRLRALLAGAGREMPVERLHLQPRGAFLDVMIDEDLAWIVASARRLGPLDLLVLDPLRDVHSGEEDTSDSMRDVMRRLRVLGVLLGCTILAVHHSGKPNEANAKRGGGQRLRGSGAIHGSIDSGIYITNTTGDGVSSFKMSIENEIKGARSAGFFTLTLEIEDGDDGQAIRAAWTYERENKAAKPKKLTAKEQAAAAKSAQNEEDDRRALAFVYELAQQGVYESRRKLRNHNGRPPGISVHRMTASIERLRGAGRLVLVGEQVRPPEPPAEHRAGDEP